MTADDPAAKSVSLLVTCHPNAASLCGHISERVTATLRARGATVVVNDLHGAGFNPVPSTPELQSYFDPTIPEDIRGLVADLRSARELIFVLPIWMFTMPAILKGYFDRVWRPHVAFSFDGKDLSPLLTGIESLTVIATHGRNKAETDEAGDGSRIFFSSSLTTLLPNLKSNERFDFYALDEPNSQAVEHELEHVLQHLNRQTI
jgi:putative NADPH-quinone reductase